MIGASHEALVESFESIWQSASSSAPDLQSFLRDHASAIATTDQDSLLCDLAEIDLEWRWRLAEKRYPRISWKQYATVMKLGATHALRLAQRELLVRIRWGDNPLIRELGDGTEDQHWAQEMGRVLTQRYPMIASVLHDGQPILRTVVPFRSSWGRQSATEPPAPTVVQDPPHFVRVLFARREENRVSRKQFHLTALVTIGWNWIHRNPRFRSTTKTVRLRRSK